MKYKMTIGYLNITNYPYIKKYLEEMARKGWLLNKIALGNIFIFKNIEPQELEFSISPYEDETVFERKTKGEISEFESVCETIGWSYCTKSHNLFIYYKEKDSEVLDIHTDEEEEFKLLNKIGKRQIRFYYFLIPFLILISWRNLQNIESVYFMKSGIAQLTLPLMPIGIILTLFEWFQIGGFLRKNKKNIDLGREIEYKDSKLNVLAIGLFVTFVIFLISLIYFIKISILSKNRIVFINFLPMIIAIVIGILYRHYIKPLKFSKAISEKRAQKVVRWYINELGREIKADADLWNVDEAYYIRIDRTGIVIRKGKEVFVLTGKDFNYNKTVEISKEKLGLN